MKKMPLRIKHSKWPVCLEDHLVLHGDWIVSQRARMYLEALLGKVFNCLNKRLWMKKNVMVKNITLIKNIMAKVD